MSQQIEPEANTAEICPICLGELEQRMPFYWLLSPPAVSLLLGRRRRLCVRLDCCPPCQRKIWLRRWLLLGLCVEIPLVAYGFYTLFPAWASEVVGWMLIVVLSYGIVVGTFAATGLDRVRVNDEALIERGKALSRKRLHNSTPWLLAALSPWGATKVFLAEETTGEGEDRTA